VSQNFVFQEQLILLGLEFELQLVVRLVSLAVHWTSQVEKVVHLVVHWVYRWVVHWVVDWVVDWVAHWAVDWVAHWVVHWVVHWVAHWVARLLVHRPLVDHLLVLLLHH
jgi:hypothetical protein